VSTERNLQVGPVRAGLQRAQALPEELRRVKTIRGIATTHTQTWLEIAAFVAVVMADAMGLVPLTQTIFLLPLVWVSLRLRREDCSTLGFARPRQAWLAIAFGAVAGVLLEGFAMYVTTPWISAQFGVAPDYSQFDQLRGNLPQLLLFLALSWTLAAFGEEICFRGFLMPRVASVLGDGRVAWLASLLLCSALFGWGHTEQGVSGWVQEGLSGLLLGVLYLVTGRNLWVPIVAHGVSNTVAFVLIYSGRYGA
jgi:membrane protease YdiL (CAAX protease family)